MGHDVDAFVAGPASPEAVAVIIPSLMSGATLEKCLEALLAQRTSWPFHVTVVHSGPRPISPAVRRRFGQVTFEAPADCELPGDKRNWAWRRTNARWVVFLDSDCVATSDWLERLMTTATSSDAWGVGGGVQIARPRRIRSWSMHVLEFGEWLPTEKSRPCDDFPSCNAAYRRTALVEVGGYLEGVFPCEDTLLNHRMRQGGGRLLFDPRAVVSHIHTRSVRQVVRYNYEFGLTYGMVSARFQLRGYRMARSRAWIPSVVLARLITAVRRVQRYGGGRELLYCALCLPFMVICLFAWAIGFTRGGRGGLICAAGAGPLATALDA